MFEDTGTYPRDCCIRIAGIGSKGREAARLIENRGITGCDFLYVGICEYENYSQLTVASGTCNQFGLIESANETFVDQFYDTDLAVIIVSLDELMCSKIRIDSIIEQSDMTYLILLDQGTNNRVISESDYLLSQVDMWFRFGIENNGNVHQLPHTAFQDTLNQAYLTLRALVESVTWQEKFICIDYVDLRTVTQNTGQGCVFHVETSGVDRAHLASCQIIDQIHESVIADDMKNLVVNVNTGMNFKMNEYNDISDILTRQLTHEYCSVISVNQYENISDMLTLTIIVAGSNSE